MTQPPAQKENLEEPQGQNADENNNQNQQIPQTAAGTFFAVNELFEYQKNKQSAIKLFNEEGINPNEIFKPEYLGRVRKAVELAEGPEILGIKFGVRVEKSKIDKAKEAIKEAEVALGKKSGLENIENEGNKVYIRSLQRLHGLSDDEMAEVMKSAKLLLKEGRSTEEALRLETLRKTRFKVEQIEREIRQEAQLKGVTLSSEEIENLLSAKLNGETLGTIEEKSKKLAQDQQLQRKEGEKQILNEGRQKVAQALGVELKPEITSPPPAIMPKKTLVSPATPGFSFAQLLSDIKQSFGNLFQTKIWQPFSNIPSVLPKVSFGGIGSGLNLGEKISSGLKDLGSLFKIGVPKVGSAVGSTVFKGALGAASGGIGFVLAGLASTILANAKQFVIILIAAFVVLFLALSGPTSPFSPYTGQNSLQIPQSSAFNNKFYSWKQFENNFLTIKKFDVATKPTYKKTISWNDFKYLTLDPNGHDDVKK